MSDPQLHWNQLSIGQRIVKAAWMAAREHLEQSEQSDDQAAELRRLIVETRFRTWREGSQAA